MPTTNEYRALYGQGGKCRLMLKEAWGDWADEFCDGLLLRLIAPKQSCKIHLWKHKDGFQVNVDSLNTGGYTNDISSDPLGTIGERFAALVRDPDADEAGDSSED